MKSPRTRTLVPAQIVAALLGLAALALWPPASGAMLLVPLGGGNDGARAVVTRVALAGGALVLGAGPFPGSMVVIGDRARIAHGMKSWTMVITAAPAAGCGDGSVSGRPA